MNTAQTMDEQMAMRSLHTGGVGGSNPPAPTTQTQTNTGFVASDKGVNAGSAEPSTTLADRYGAGVDPASERQISDKGAEEAAWRIIDMMPNRTPLKTDIARILVAAILEERKRCVEQAEYVVKNIEHRITNRQRFSVFDMNRAFRAGARLVGEQINHEAEWQPLPAPPTPPQETGHER